MLQEKETDTPPQVLENKAKAVALQLFGKRNRIKVGIMYLADRIDSGHRIVEVGGREGVGIVTCAARNLCIVSI